MKIVRCSDPLTALPMAAATREALRACGIDTVGALFDAPETLLRRLGQARRLVQQMARGNRELGLLEWGMELPARRGKLFWSLEKGVLTLWGDGVMEDYPPEKPAPWAPWAGEIRELRAEEAVQALGAMAFAGCTALERVVLCESVRRIGAGAFRGCAALAAVESPRRMESLRLAEEGELALGEGAFDGAAFRPDLPEGLRIRNGEVVEYRGPGGTVEIPEGVERIGIAAFENRAVTAVKLPRSLKQIGPCAFRGTALEELILPKGLEAVESWAFAEIPTLRRVVIRNKSMKAAQNAFAGTPVARRARDCRGKWPALLQLQVTREPGMEGFGRLGVGENPEAAIGTAGFATRTAVRRLLREGNMLLRIIPEENRVRFVDAIYIHPYYGLSRFRTEPCRSEKGFVEPWRDEEDRYDSLQTERFDLTGIRKPGRVQWYTVPYRRYAEFDTPLTLLECWLKNHPEYSIPTAEECFNGWWPGPMGSGHAA